MYPIIPQCISVLFILLVSGCRCTLQSQCSRGGQPGQWLWSFDMEQHCLYISDLNPSNVSREESRPVSPLFFCTNWK